MDVHASLDADCDADRLFSFVDDLAKYPDWMDLTHRVEADAESSDAAWNVELRARLGPLARSKRLRMQRSVHDTVAHVVVFERAEADGKRHSHWVLKATVTQQSQQRSRLEMHLHYDGALWTGGVLERVLTDQITSGRGRLQKLVSPSPTR
ncbi:MAG: SRPBCC family protein [Actinomycetota bacterium]